ncbi:hypothetical protein LguiB_002665 [Lonicera macranthoides]
MAPPQASSTAPVFYYRNVKIDVIASELIVISCLQVPSISHIQFNKQHNKNFGLHAVGSRLEDALLTLRRFKDFQLRGTLPTYFHIKNKAPINREDPIRDYTLSLACQLNISSAHVAREGNKVANWLADDTPTKPQPLIIETLTGDQQGRSYSLQENKIQYPRDNEAINQCLKIELEGSTRASTKCLRLLPGVGSVVMALGRYRRMYMVYVRPVVSRRREESGQGRRWSCGCRCFTYVEYYERSLGGVGGGASSLMFIYKVVK